jgi:CRP-like cAMP-binding protein
VEALADVLTDDERADLRRHTSERRYSRNEVVFHEGDPGDSLHIVERGLFVARSSSTLGHLLTVNVFGPGSVFGEIALLARDSVRTATVVAVDGGRTRVLRRTDLHELRSRDVGRHIDEFLLAALAERSGELTARVIELLFTPTTKRIQRELLRLGDLGIGDDGDGWIRLSQAELAMLTASTRATVNRVLRDLERNGIVELGRGRSRIVDRRQLASRSR